MEHFKDFTHERETDFGLALSHAYSRLEYIKGEPLSNSENIQLRHIVDDLFEEFYGKNNLRFMSREACAKFLADVVGIDIRAQDEVGQGGLGVGSRVIGMRHPSRYRAVREETEEVREIWKRHERDGEVPYDEWRDVKKAKVNKDKLPGDK